MTSSVILVTQTSLKQDLYLTHPVWAIKKIRVSLMHIEGIVSTGEVVYLNMNTIGRGKVNYSNVDNLLQQIVWSCPSVFLQSIVPNSIGATCFWGVDSLWFDIETSPDIALFCLSLELKSMNAPIIIGAFKAIWKIEIKHFENQSFGFK